MKAELKACGLWFLFLLTLLWMTSCKTPAPVVVTEKVTETVTETVHDTIFKTEKDTSLYQALLECQQGKVVVKEVTNAQPGKYLKAPKVRIKDNRLECDCEAEAQKLYAQWKSKHTITDKIKEVPVIVKDPLTKWQLTQIWLGRILLLLVAYKILKFIYNPIKS